MRTSRAWLLRLTCAACVACVACASGPSAPPAGKRPTAIAPAGAPWQSQLDRDHPLVGLIWDVRAAKYVELDALLARVRTSELVLLGEQHDNPDHHRLQAQLLESLLASGRRPAVVFEMLDVEQQATVEGVRVSHRGPEALADAVQWEKSGWPPFSLYRALFAQAFGASLRVLAGGIDRERAMRVAREGSAALDPELVARFGLASTLAPQRQARVRSEMADAHCGLLPASSLDAMVLVQRARDAQLAERLRAGAEGGRGGALLIAGNGHVDVDQGVPEALQLAYAAPSLALGLLEVKRDALQPQDYARARGRERLPFDFVWFTPRISDVDHCAELRASMGGDQQKP